MAKALLLVVVLAFAFGAAVIWSQDDIIFPTSAVASAGPMPRGAEGVSFDGEDGEHLHGVHFQPVTNGSTSDTLIVGFAGNAWNAQHAASYLHDLYPDAHVMAFHYRGYAPSTGTPSADALVADAPRVLEFAIDRMKPKRTVAVGFSIGSAVAASLGSRSGVDGIILVTPFDSLKAVAGELYPWLPVGLFFRHELNTVQLLGRSQVPVAIIAAERDRIVPPARTAALRGAIPNLVYDRTIAGVGHNDLYDRSEFKSAMKEALRAVLPQ